MRAEIEARYGRWLAEMFYEHQAAYLGKDKIPEPSKWEVEMCENLLAPDPDGDPGDRITFEEAKRVLGWLFCTRAGDAYWAKKISSVREWINAFPTLVERTWKHRARTGEIRVTAGQVKPGEARTGADHIASQPHTAEAKAAAEAEFLRVTREANNSAEVLDIEQARQAARNATKDTR